MQAIIFGGTGQIGRSIKAALEKAGWRVAVATRSVHEATQDGRVPFRMDDAALESAIAGMDAVVNCVGILAPQGQDTFERIHHELPERLAKAAQKKNVSRFIHISALGADAQSPSAYARSKAAGEAAVLAACPHAVIFRPSIVFGPHDSFFNRFAAMAKFSPALPLIGGGHSKFQPVYVEDVAAAVMRALNKATPVGVTFTLGGPDIYTFKELMQFILKTTGLHRLLLPLPWEVAEIQAWVLERCPGKILTRDQLKLLRSDNVVPHAAAGFRELDIKPKSVSEIVPTYLK